LPTVTLPSIPVWIPFCMKILLFFFLLHFSAVLPAQQRTDSVPPAAPRLKKMRDSLFPFAPQLKLFPNPVKNRTELEVRNFDAGEVTVLMATITGTKVYAATRLVAGNLDRIVLMLQLPPGIYFCTVQQKQKRAKIKLVVE
jgi:hypothetical protein